MSDHCIIFNGMNHEMRRCWSVSPPILWRFPRRTLKDCWAMWTRNGKQIGFTWTRLNGGNSDFARLTVRVIGGACD